MKSKNFRDWDIKEKVRFIAGRPLIQKKKDNIIKLINGAYISDLNKIFY